MFTLPKNTQDVVRQEVVDRLVEGIYKRKSLNWSHYGVYMDEEGGLVASHGTYHDSEEAARPRAEFSQRERDAAFEVFRKAGYHIRKLTYWNGAYFFYLETTFTLNNGDNEWLF